MEGIFNTEKNALKGNIAMSYVIYKPIYEKDEKGNNIEPQLGYQIRYCYYLSVNNNAMFVHPVEIHDRKTLTKFIHDSVIKIAELDTLGGTIRYEAGFRTSLFLIRNLNFSPK